MAAQLGLGGAKTRKGHVIGLRFLSRYAAFPAKRAHGRADHRDREPLPGLRRLLQRSQNWPRFTTEEDAALDLIPEKFVNERLSGMRCEGDRCSALSGKVGEMTACLIYAMRPEVCRTCMPGDVESRWHGSGTVAGAGRRSCERRNPYRVIYQSGSLWLGSRLARSLSSGAHSRDPLAWPDDENFSLTLRRHRLEIFVVEFILDRLERRKRLGRRVIGLRLP